MVDASFIRARLSAWNLERRATETAPTQVSAADSTRKGAHPADLESLVGVLKSGKEREFHRYSVNLVTTVAI
jgi:hypothetical protein